MLSIKSPNKAKRIHTFEPHFNSTISKQSHLLFHRTPMEDYYYCRNHFPAFGSWDCNNDLPFTQCFESARQVGLLRYGYSEDRDLYVAGDLYDNDVVSPAMIVVPRKMAKKRQNRVKEEKIMQTKLAESELKELPSTPPMQRPTQKPVDEDLYKISPKLLYSVP